MLHELSSSILVLHTLLPQGKFAWVLQFPLLTVST